MSSEKGRRTIQKRKKEHLKYESIKQTEELKEVSLNKKECVVDQ